MHLINNTKHGLQLTDIIYIKKLFHESFNMTSSGSRIVIDDLAVKCIFKLFWKKRFNYLPNHDGTNVLIFTP